MTVINQVKATVMGHCPGAQRSRALRTGTTVRCNSRGGIIRKSLSSTMRTNIHTTRLTQEPPISKKKKTKKRRKGSGTPSSP